MQRSIKVGILVSYDYDLLRNSLPPIYEHADKIVLAVDKDNKTWAGNVLHIPDDFWQWIKDFDVLKKIEIYKDAFYVENSTTMQCDTRERNMLANYMGAGGWHIQIDSDEYFTDFKDFVDFLHYLDRKKRHINCVNIQWLHLYKKTANCFLFIKQSSGRGVPFATTVPNYINARKIKNQRPVLYPKRVIHDSWARSEEALWTKLKNWSHNSDFDTDGYFCYWKVIDESNYMFARNIHPTVPEFWTGLEKIDGGNIQELLENIKSSEGLLDAKKFDMRFEKTRKIVNLLLPPIFPKLYKKYLDKKEKRRHP
jgi:hypothetical protein